MIRASVNDSHTRELNCDFLYIIIYIYIYIYLANVPYVLNAVIERAP